MPNSLRTPPAIEPESTIDSVLHAHPTTAAVFNAFGVDACCGGARSLHDAANEDGADRDALLAALRGAATEAGAAA